MENFPVEFEFRLDERIELLCLVSFTKLLIFLILSFDDLLRSVEIPDFVYFQIIDLTFYLMCLVDSKAEFTASFCCFYDCFFSIIFSYLE
jgi:hypothetical protein